MSGFSRTVDQEEKGAPRAAAPLTILQINDVYSKSRADVRVNGEPLDAAKTYTVAMPDFVFKGADGYTMFAGQRVIVGPEAGNLIVDALQKAVAGKREIAPHMTRDGTAR